MRKPEIREVYNHPSALEPLFPVDRTGELREMAADLIRKSAALGEALHPMTQKSVAELLRAMNSYYSNLIEGHNTHPLAIERALRNDYSSDPALRALQLESKAHIEVQSLIERRLEENPATQICAPDFLRWIHLEFYERLPDEFRVVTTVGGGKDSVAPGELRRCEAEVGRHVAPAIFRAARILDTLRGRIRHGGNGSASASNRRGRSASPARMDSPVSRWKRPRRASIHDGFLPAREDSGARPLGDIPGLGAQS